MASDSASPPPSGGNTKYVIIGALFLVAAGVLWFAIQPGDPPGEPEGPPVVASAERTTALVEDTLELPEPVEDAGTPVEDAAAPVKRVRTGGGGRDAWECGGEIPPAAAREVIAQNRSQVRSCYERRLKVVNMLQGTLNLQLRIDQDGKVSHVRRAGGTLNDAETFSCVRQLAETWRFPPPSGDRCAVLTAPFNLTPRP